MSVKLENDGAKKPKSWIDSRDQKGNGEKRDANQINYEYFGNNSA